MEVSKQTNQTAQQKAQDPRSTSNKGNGESALSHLVTAAVAASDDANKLPQSQQIKPVQVQQKAALQPPRQQQPVAFNNNVLQQCLQGITLPHQNNISTGQIQPIHALLSALQSAQAATPVPAMQPSLQNIAGMSMGVGGGAPLDIIGRLGMLMQQPQQQPPQVQWPHQVQQPQQPQPVLHQQPQVAEPKQVQQQQPSSAPTAPPVQSGNGPQQANDGIQVNVTHTIPSAESSEVLNPETTSSTQGNGEAATGGVNAPNIAGDIILPCRARGMPVDHNFRVRYCIDSVFLCLYLQNQEILTTFLCPSLNH